MRILFVSHYGNYGGPQNRAKILSKPLLEHGWETVVLMPDEPGNARARLESAGVEVVTTKLGRARATKNVRVQYDTLRSFAPDVQRIRRVIRNVGADVVIIGGLMNPHAAIAANLERVPVIWQIVDSSTPTLWRRALLPYVLRASRVIMTTGILIGESQLGHFRHKCNWIPFYSPVDTSEFSPGIEASRSAYRNLLGVGEDELLVGTVGNINPLKGYKTLIEAMALVQRSGIRAKLRIAGQTLSTQLDYKKDLIQLVATLGVDANPEAVFVNPGDSVASMMSAFDLFALSSVSEGVPTALMEAMSTGLASVATNVGGVREILKDGYSGFVVPPLASEIMAERIITILTDEGLRRDMAGHARNEALQRFDIRFCLQRHLEALTIAIGRI